MPELAKRQAGRKRKGVPSRRRLIGAVDQARLNLALIVMVAQHGADAALEMYCGGGM